LNVVLSGVQSAASVGDEPSVNNVKKVQLPGLPLEFGDERRRTKLRLQPPQLGEHTQEILLENGFSDVRIDRLIASCVVA
jgi:crotonobetainyl-CoA:carnitine CoA-transferase CaiB-like acyl-CoA transferase